jgi:uncharacterized protein (TIGR03437 family)
MMRRIATVLAACSALLWADGSARRAAPSYSASGIVDSAGFTPGALAPYSLATIFGEDLAFGAAQAALTPAGLPFDLGGVRVIISGYAAQLVYVSEKQINLLVPNLLRPGQVTVQVFRQGLAGPAVPIALGEVAPGLFRTPAGTVIATHSDNSVVDAASPARPGEIVVLYAAGLGRTLIELPERTPPAFASQIVKLADFRLLLDGVPVDRGRIQYVGVTPGWPGLYQINAALPEDCGPNPEVRIAVGDRVSPAELKLPVR